MANAVLTISSRNYSSWSLRGWLLCRLAGITIDEQHVSIDDPNNRAELLLLSPSVMVPRLTHEGASVWDTLAIAEYLNEVRPKSGLLPEDRVARAHCRAICGEMHSGFASLRGECPMDLSLRSAPDLSDATHKDIHRITALLGDLRARYAGDGPFLCGAWSIADAFFTPVATRFRSYGVILSDFGDLGAAGVYVETLLQQPDFLEWERAALAEPKPAGVD